jgi:hypothetical protein
MLSKDFIFVLFYQLALKTFSEITPPPLPKSGYSPNFLRTLFQQECIVKIAIQNMLGLAANTPQSNGRS